MAEKNLFIYIFLRLGLEPYNICTNPETGETPLEGRLCVYILHFTHFHKQNQIQLRLYWVCGDGELCREGFIFLPCNN
jgi:hypothetical protein